VKQGLIGNALTEYRNLVAYYDKNAMYQEAIEVLEKMAELDPDNLNIVAKTAECYVALDRTDDALEKIQDIVAPLAARGEHIKVIKLYDRFLDICPDEGPSRLPLAKALIGNGAPDKAIQILKPLLKHAPEDPEINRCLAEAYVADKDFDNARLTLKHLLKQDETDLDLCTAYIRVCFDANDPEQAQHQLDKWQNAFFEQDRLSLLHELYGQLQQCLPEDDAVAETLAAIADIINEAAEPDQSEPLEAAADDATPDDPATNDTPVDVVDPERRTVDKTGDSSPPEKLAAVGIELGLDLQVPIAEREPVTTLSSSTVANEADDLSAEAAEDAPDEVEVEVFLGDLDDLDQQLAEDAGNPPDVTDADQAAVAGVAETFETVDERQMPERLEAVGNLEEELEDAEFYLQQGLFDEALRVVDSLLENQPEAPELLAKRVQINQFRTAAEQDVESADFTDLMADVKDDDLFAATDFLDSFAAEADVENDHELTQKTVAELDAADTESHFNLGIAYKEMGLYNDALVEFEKASRDPGRLIDCITLTGQCLIETGDTESAMTTFRQGLSQDDLSDENRMTLNFELGMLYQNNGQPLEALECFQLAAEHDSFYRDVGELIKTLRRELGLDDSSDDGPQGNRDRVSYI
ncbi:MAG: tetratricopeptide repeat protein, partial [Desulfuromonadales bacterium]